MFDAKTFTKDWIYAGTGSVELEEIVLATLINFPNNIYVYSSELSIAFFDSAHTKIIFQSIIESSKESKVDIIIICDRLKSKGDDIIASVNAICERVQTDVHLSEHIKILSDYAQRRGLLELSGYMQKESVSGTNPDDILKNINIQLANITAINNEMDFDPHIALCKMVDKMQSTTNTNLVKSRHDPLDEFIYGFELSNFIVIAGAPSMGKTSYALAIYSGWILHDEPAVFISLEMTETELLQKVICSNSNVPMSKANRRILSNKDWESIHSFISVLEKKQWYIEEKTFDLYKICNKIRKYFFTKGVKRFIIDYLQLCNVSLGKNSLREQEIATITRTFKLLAKELNILIIGLSQISRGVNSRTNKRPTLSDLRESGAIEQDADMVIFPFREAYYLENKRDIPYMEDIEFIIAKGRSTGVGVVYGKFISCLSKFPSNEYVDATENKKESNDKPIKDEKTYTQKSAFDSQPSDSDDDPF